MFQILTVKLLLTEGLVDGQVSLDDEHGSSGCLGLLEDVSTTSVQDSVDSTDCVFGALKFFKRFWMS
jgi:hypothetical protein